MPHNKLFVVYYEEQDSPTGVAFSGIFDNKDNAENWALSEGPYYKVAETSYGPIDWNKFNPLPTVDWNNEKWK